MKFRERLEKITKELESHPDIEVYGLHFGTALDEQVVRDAMVRLGVGPYDEVIQFYMEHNGAFLEWGLRGREYEEVGFGGMPDYGSPPGCINILPIGDVFSESWQLDAIVQTPREEHWQAAFGQSIDFQQKCKIVVFDNYSRFEHTDMLLGPEPILLVATDHGADLGASNLMTLSQYLEVVLALYGTNPYQEVGINWSKKARRLESVSKYNLEDLIAKIRLEPS